MPQTTLFLIEIIFLLIQALNVTDQSDFYRGLRDIFLHFPLTEQFRYDVVFNEDGTEVIASRYIIQTKNITDANMEKEMLITLREIADSFPFTVTIYHHYFIFFDQFVLVRSISIQTITMAAIVMMIISLIFIPSPSCAIWVAFSIISIEIGVIGYMTLWNVNLDSISMINLIMCIGFSVDFSAHISYAYISCNERSPDEKVRSALYSLGLPIFQGSVSTVLGIIALAFAPSYVFVTFFKTVFLVMLFGATHGVLLLPVLLSLTEICHIRPKTRPETLTDSHTIDVSNKHHPHLHYKSSNLAVMNKDSPFFTTDKYFNGKTIVHKTGGPIYIPRPSFIGLDSDNNGHVKLPERSKVVDEVSVEGSKSLSVSDGSMVAEKDLGLGTSAEECSESSWKGEKNDNEVIKKQPQSHVERIGSKQTNRNWDNLNQHINAGYVSDSADHVDDEIGKTYISRSKSSDIAESRRQGKSSRELASKTKLPHDRGQQNRLNAYRVHDPRNMPDKGNHFNNTKQLEMRKSSSNRAGSSTMQPKGPRFVENDGQHRNRHPPPIGEGNPFHYFDFDYNSYWDSRWADVGKENGRQPTNAKYDNSPSYR